MTERTIWQQEPIWEPFAPFPHYDMRTWQSCWFHQIPYSIVEGFGELITFG